MEIILTLLDYIAGNKAKIYFFGLLLNSVIVVYDIISTPWSVYNTSRDIDSYKLDGKTKSNLYYSIGLVYIPALVSSVAWPVHISFRSIRRIRYIFYAIGVKYFKRKRSSEKELLQFAIPFPFFVDPNDKDVRDNDNRKR